MQAGTCLVADGNRSTSLQSKLQISTDGGADGASPDGSVVDGASPMSLAAGADFADLVSNACNHTISVVRMQTNLFHVPAGRCLRLTRDTDGPDVP